MEYDKNAVGVFLTDELELVGHIPIEISSFYTNGKRHWEKKARSWISGSTSKIPCGDE